MQVHRNGNTCTVVAPVVQTLHTAQTSCSRFPLVAMEMLDAERNGNVSITGYGKDKVKKMGNPWGIPDAVSAVIGQVK